MLTVTHLYPVHTTELIGLQSKCKLYQKVLQFLVNLAFNLYIITIHATYCGPFCSNGSTCLWYDKHT